VHRDVADALLALMAKITSNLIVGDPRGIGGGSRNQSVFMGPIIRAEQRDALLASQAKMMRAGARPIIEATAMDHPSKGHYISPGILRVERFTRSADIADGCGGGDEELFGPLLRVSITDSLDDAIEQANATGFGLAGAIFTRDQASIDRFLREAGAGCLNVNTGTAGASSKLPFGGLGRSGNHRSAGAFSLDYTAYPVASLIETGAEAGILPGMHFDEAWVKTSP
jgi:succinylglutamic semialdehyde dehydrogenase